MTDKTAVKLELLKLAVELTKCAITQNKILFANPQPRTFEEAFAVCHKLVSDNYYQAKDDQI
jgi:hypothetical protein